MRFLLVLTCLGPVASQLAGHLNIEGAPAVVLKECTNARGCRPRRTKATLDANWRWLHDAKGYQNCYKDGDWDAGLCPDPETCARNCALEGVTAAEYGGTCGISSVDGGLELKFATQTQNGANYGSRVYLTDGLDSYKMFKLKNREFAMDVDVSKLPCGLNGAVYFVEMDKHGLLGGGNKAGAKYGTGYCDAQCPHDVKFIAGEANLLEWDASASTPVGHYGSCCAEMDIWEANSMATAYTPHPCALEGPLRCEGTDCGDSKTGERYDGVCDKDGCDYNSYRLGEPGFYGADSGFAVDTSRPFTVVTQFLTADGTDTGDLSEIRRFYVQDGSVVPNSNATLLGPDAGNSVTNDFCAAQKAAFGDTDDFTAKGGLKQMGDALGRGVVLVLSLWDDSDVNMLWLDSAFPADQDDSVPGIARGPCLGGEESTPTYLRANYADAAVQFTNLAVGEIGSTSQPARRL